MQHPDLPYGLRRQQMGVMDSMHQVMWHGFAVAHSEHRARSRCWRDSVPHSTRRALVQHAAVPLGLRDEHVCCVELLHKFL